MRIRFLLRIFVPKIAKMEKLRYYILTLCLCLSVSFAGASKVWNAKNIPVPYLQNSTQYVSDPDHYIDKQALDSANFYLDKLNKECRVQNVAHPIYLGENFLILQKNLYLCAMNNQGLLSLAQLILPSEILSNFEVVRVEEEASLIRIYLDESVKAEYKENPEIESKGFCEAVTIRDFPIRDKGVDLIVRRRKWYDKQNNQYFSDSYELKAEGTRYSKEFAAFLKGVYGDDSYDLPFA